MTSDERIVRRPSLSLATGLVLIMLGLAACGSERDITGSEPDQPGIALVALTVHVRLQPSDASLASALGWEAGVPDAEVSLLRSGTADWIRVRTDASGQARVADLLRGLYRVYTGRLLTAEEASGAQLPIRSFGDGITTEFRVSGEQSLELELSSDVPGSLLISEISNSAPPVWETGGSYSEADYFEVYNNSGRTRFLDGMVFGATLSGQDNIHGHCAHSQDARTDPLGVYALMMLAFPGAGGEYPIGPGETRLVALSAIDHTAVHPDLPDLSRADFEIRSIRVADNPAVPDMIDIGLEGHMTAAGSRILRPWKIGSFLAEPFDPRELPVMYRDFGNRGYVRIPRDLLLDVVGRASVYADLERRRPVCVPLIHPDFERYEGGFYTIGLGVESRRLSFQRRGLRSEGGRDILSNSNTSAVDFVLADLTPGVVLQPDR